MKSRLLALGALPLLAAAAAPLLPTSLVPEIVECGTVMDQTTSMTGSDVTTTTYDTEEEAIAAAEAMLRNLWMNAFGIWGIKCEEDTCTGPFDITYTCLGVLGWDDGDPDWDVGAIERLDEEGNTVWLGYYNFEDHVPFWLECLDCFDGPVPIT